MIINFLIIIQECYEKNSLKLAAKAAYATAKKAGNSASIYGMYQPKEPKM